MQLESLSNNFSRCWWKDRLSDHTPAYDGHLHRILARKSPSLWLVGADTPSIDLFYIYDYSYMRVFIRWVICLSPTSRSLRSCKKSFELEGFICLIVDYHWSFSHNTYAVSVSRQLLRIEKFLKVRSLSQCFHGENVQCPVVRAMGNQCSRDGHENLRAPNRWYSHRLRPWRPSTRLSGCGINFITFQNF